MHVYIYMYKSYVYIEFIDTYKAYTYANKYNTKNNVKLHYAYIYIHIYMYVINIYH